MEQAYIKVNQAINTIFEIHEKHMAAFEEDSLPDLEAQTLERKEALDQLQATIGEFLPLARAANSSEAKSMMSFFNNRVSTLLELNRAIENRVQAIKTAIGKSMQQLAANRHGIRSYGAPESVRNRPRAINFRN